MKGRARAVAVAVAVALAVAIFRLWGGERRLALPWGCFLDC